ncbi:MAG: 50S ribosomal protein L13 [Verrucomicrobiota bacterium]
MKTFSAKNEEQDRKWFIIDANKRVIGAVAVEAANLLRGKNKVTYTPHIDNGDHVVIINAEKAVFTGKKEVNKQYTRFSGYVGGHHSDTPKSLRARRPEQMLTLAIRGMIPHNRLGRQILTKLRIYRGTEHPHVAQEPVAYTF